MRWNKQSEPITTYCRMYIWTRRSRLWSRFHSRSVNTFCFLGWQVSVLVQKTFPAGHCRLISHFFPVYFEPQLQRIKLVRLSSQGEFLLHWRGREMQLSDRGGGGYFLVKGYWGCAAGWGRIFHNWTDYNGVTFLVELLEWGRTFSGFWDKKVFVSRDLKIGRFVVKNGSCSCLNI